MRLITQNPPTWRLRVPSHKLSSRPHVWHCSASSEGVFRTWARLSFGKRTLNRTVTTHEAKRANIMPASIMNCTGKDKWSPCFERVNCNADCKTRVAVVERPDTRAKRGTPRYAARATQ